MAQVTMALVLETNNLHGGGNDTSRVAAGVARLLRRLREQTHPLTELEHLVITHEGLDAAGRARLEREAGRSIRFVELPRGTSYYEAKNAGFDATSTEVVAFGDADCWPEPGWLEHLLGPFLRGERGEVKAVAGRTCYREDLLGIAATTIDFMYFDSPLGEGCTRNFYANNVAFRREVFAAHRYGDGDPFYRGNCQVLGLRLQAAGVPVRFEPRARTVHRFPDSTAELLTLRLLRGGDSVELSRHLGDAYLPARLRWLSRLGPFSAAAVLAARFGFSVRSVNAQDMPEVHGLERLRCLGLIAALSLVDGVGAVAKGVGLKPAAEVLSYHQDADRLAAAA